MAVRPGGLRGAAGADGGAGEAAVAGGAGDLQGNGITVRCWLTPGESGPPPPARRDSRNAGKYWFRYEVRTARIVLIIEIGCQDEYAADDRKTQCEGGNVAQHFRSWISHVPLKQAKNSDKESNGREAQDPPPPSPVIHARD